LTTAEIGSVIRGNELPVCSRSVCCLYAGHGKADLSAQYPHLIAKRH
jgi:hypothetical protein